MTTRDDHDQLSRRADELQRVLEIHPADFDLQSRGRAFEEALLVRGHGELAAAIRVLVELLTGRLPCGHQPSVALVEDPEIAALHEPQGPPIDGREVDRAPEDVGAVFAAGRKAAMDAANVDAGFRPNGPALLGDFDVYLTPQTGGRSVAPPEADLPSPHATKES